MYEEIKKVINSFIKYSKFNLKIKPKTGPLVPLVLNRAQIYVHERLEAQKQRLGYVRAVILKGRQQGISTGIGGRFYWLTTTNLQTNCFIFAHDASGTDSLFKMVKRYYDNTEQEFKPNLGTSNKNELSFDKLGSSYRVGTAGSKALGRSQTNQLLHWSEVAYSPDQEEHSTGIMQTVPLANGTEIILESTANFNGDYFHLMVLEGLSGDSDWETIFVPWYWQDEYKRVLDDNFELDKEEQEYYNLYHQDGLTKEHLCWRRHKIREFKGDKDRFKKEYPFSIEEAFEISDDEAFIKASLVEKAIKTPFIQSGGAKVWGVDPARLGGDEFKVTERIGRNTTRTFKIPAGKTNETSNLLAIEINKHKPDVVNIDVGGLGVAVYDNLSAIPEYKDLVNAVNFGGEADDKTKYVNKRNEMYDRAKEWLLAEPCSISVDEQNAIRIKSELSMAKKGWDNNQRLKIESKDEIKKRLKRSPDTGDSFILTFAKIVANPDTIKYSTTIEVNTSWIV